MSKSRPKTFAERVKSMHSLCDPECEGRCRECPDDLIRDMLEHLDKLEESKNG